MNLILLLILITKPSKNEKQQNIQCETRNAVLVYVRVIANLGRLFIVTKTKSDDAAKFVGTWNGTVTGGGVPAGSSSFTFAANGSGLSTPGSVGSTGCVKAVSLNVSASGNNLSVPSQTFTDGCANSYTISGAGSLSGNTLTLTESVSGTLSVTCVFVGTK
jgi:hypothetical protein